MIDPARTSEQGGLEMETVIAKLLQDFEHGKMNRRQLIQSLSLAAVAAAAGMPQAARAAGKPLTRNAATSMRASWG
jgi:hypothetical protein